MPKATVKVLPKPGTDPAPVVLIETAIIELAAGMKKLTSTRLKREAIVLLLHDASNVGKPAIRAILNSMDQLEALFLKPRL